MSIEPGLPVALALGALLVLALIGHHYGRYGLQGPVLVAGTRALVQLTVVALVIAFVVEDLWLSSAFVLVMFATAVLTTSRRVGGLAVWPGAAAAMGVALVPVLAIILGTGAVPAEGIAVIPVAGIIIGNTMTAHTLAGRRAFDALREGLPQYEAGLSVGMLPQQAIREIIHDRVPEALVPGLDQVRTTGLVTLPGAFIGVMLGGGSPVQAATAQVLVLFGIMAAQVITVVLVERLVAAGRLMPDDVGDLLAD
ncbi:ABC transporter permease [Aeromicrobium sp. CTD01-1L150]|uniref:ABC transporter permease n=1 Tax=Aeromicrobium sp. CTD01-1L150 TaxID=3341830 RepID=UPI0035BF4307